MDKYEILEKIGKGSYGLVFKGRVKATGQIVVLKKTRAKYADEGFPTSALREMANLKLLARGKNIIKLLAVEFEQYDRQLTVYLVFEFMDYYVLNLYYRIKINDASVPLVIIKNLMYHLLKGVEYCHRHGVIHKDLKSHNLLLNIDAGLLKVADMGLGRVQRKKDMGYSLQVETLWYKPPELLLGDLDYSFPLDIWAVGCIFAEFWNMKPLFKGDSDYDHLILIFQMLGTPNEEVWQGVSDLKHWSSQFPKFKPKDLRDFVPGLNECAFDLLSKVLQNDGLRREFRQGRH